MTVIEFVEDPRLVGDKLLSPAQRMSLKAAYGLALEPDELPLYRQTTGLSAYARREWSELTFILGEMLGELASGHAYVGGGDMPAPDRVPVGLLGCDLELDEESGRWRVARILRGQGWIEGRRRNAAHYNALLADSGITIPVEAPYARHVYHVYGVRVPNRDAVQEALQAREIQTNIHYPIPVHMQKAYQEFGYGEGDLPVTEMAAKELLSLPMFPELERGQVEEVCAAIRQEVARAG